MKLLRCLIAAAFAHTSCLHAEVRTFTSTAGTKIHGELVSVNGDMVTIKKDDGQAITVQASAFSSSDIAWLRDHGLNEKAVEASKMANITKTAPFINTLGMKFVSVPGAKVLFGIHEVRKGDYAAYAIANPTADSSWKNVMVRDTIPVSFADDHPVVKVNYKDAQGFCAWLSKKEGKTYRLPTDREWSCAVGLGDKEAANDSPASLDSKIKDVYPWGKQWPPPKGAGNFSDREAAKKQPGTPVIKNYMDGMATTAPVMSFTPNSLGIYDLAGNVFEMCDDWFKDTQKERVIRSSSWQLNQPELIMSSFRHRGSDSRMEGMGFRVVLEILAP